MVEQPLLGMMDPGTMALMQAGAALMEAGGPQPMPGSFGQAMSRAMQTGLAAYQRAQAAKQARDMQKIQQRVLLAQAAGLDRQQAAEQSLLGGINDPRQHALAAVNPKAYAATQLAVPKDTRTPAQKNAEALGYQPGTPEFVKYVESVTLPNGGQGAAGQERFSMAPTWGTDANGNPVLLQMSNMGGVRQVDVPGGVTPQRGGTTRVDLGDRWGVLDANGTVMGYLPKSLAPGEQPAVKSSQAAATAFGGGMGKGLVAKREKALEAKAALQTAEFTRDLFEDGITTGAGAQFITEFNSFLVSRLGFDSGADEVANTQAFAAAMGNEVAQVIKQFGAGSGLSDADREYAEKIAGGRITLTKDAIGKLLDMNEKAKRRVIEAYNTEARPVSGADWVKELPFQLLVDMPPRYRPRRVKSRQDVTATPPPPPGFKVMGQ